MELKYLDQIFHALPWELFLKIHEQEYASPPGRAVLYRWLIVIACLGSFWLVRFRRISLNTRATGLTTTAVSGLRSEAATTAQDEFLSLPSILSLF